MRVFDLKFLSSDVASDLYKSTLQPYMEYFCHIWADAPDFYLYMLDKLATCRAAGSTVASSLEPLSHRRNVGRLSFFSRYDFGRCLTELAELFLFLLSEVYFLSTRAT